MDLFNFPQWIAGKMRKADKQNISLDDLGNLGSEELCGEIYIRELAFWSCVNLIANAIAKCEFKTYRANKETQDREYYLWNTEPNNNQNASGFIHKWIATLYRTNECLIVSPPWDDQLFVADSFSPQNNALYGNRYTDVVVDDYRFQRTFAQEEVLHYRLSSQRMQAVIAGLYENYGKMITVGMNGYRGSRGKKALFNYDTLPTAGEERKAFDELVNTRIKTFMQSDNAALPLGKGQSLTEYGRQTTAVNAETSRDIRAMVDDITDFTARGFLVPPALLNGTVQDTSAAINQLLTFCIDPLADMLAKEINRKRNGYEGMKRGDYMKIDTRAIEHIDLLHMAPNIDKLISSACYSINDIRRAAGDTPIDEPWADQHFITRNYATIEDALQALDGLKQQAGG